MDWIPTFSKAINIVMVCVLAYGLSQRHRPKVHIPVMLTAFIFDLANVLLIEFSRGAVEQGIKSFSESGHFLEQFHITVSVLCIIGYVVAVITGTRLYRRGTGRRIHKANAAVFIVTRLSSFVTSFWMGA